MRSSLFSRGGTSKYLYVVYVAALSSRLDGPLQLLVQRGVGDGGRHLVLGQHAVVAAVAHLLALAHLLQFDLLRTYGGLGITELLFPLLDKNKKKTKIKNYIKMCVTFNICE